MKRYVHKMTVKAQGGKDFEISFSIPQFEEQGAESLFNNHKGEVYAAIIEGMTRMMNMKETRIACFCVGDLVFELGVEAGGDNLNRCLQYYESIEDYETCSFIVNQLIPYIKENQ